jgi:hypothetical protein
VILIDKVRPLDVEPLEREESVAAVDRPDPAQVRERAHLATFECALDHSLLDRLEESVRGLAARATEQSCG